MTKKKKKKGNRRSKTNPNWTVQEMNPASEESPRSAAILPFALEETTQTIYILLARTSTDGRDYRKEIWGDLGGTLESREHPEGAAAREFLEETLGIVQMSKTPEQLEAELQNGRFFMRAKLYFKADACETFYNELYLKETTFDPTVHQRFRNLRAALLQARDGVHHSLLPHGLGNHPAMSHSGTYRVKPQYLEKSSLQWFSLDYCIDLLQAKGRLGSVHIRASFAPALRIAVSELMRFAPLT